MSYPSTYRYTKEHEWIAVEGETATVGITDYAQDQLGDVVYVELPEVGQSFGSGEVFGTIESVKAASDLYLPVSGEIIGINQRVVEHPETVNQSPHERGWLIKIRIRNPAELETTLSAEEYQAQIGETG